VPRIATGSSAKRSRQPVARHLDVERPSQEEDEQIERLGFVEVDERG
jgi:hypothetical protein